MTIFMFKSKNLRSEEENINYKGTGATAMTCYTYSSLQILSYPCTFSLIHNWFSSLTKQVISIVPPMLLFSLASHRYYIVISLKFPLV